LETVLQKRQVEVSLLDRTTHFCPGKLSDILADLQKGRFIRCHKSFAINLNNIRSLDRRYAVAVNGKEIPVGRAYWDDTNDAFYEK
jgi:DNA-binding LytR/AlgR family response regulator